MYGDKEAYLDILNLDVEAGAIIQDPNSYLYGTIRFNNNSTPTMTVNGGNNLRLLAVTRPTGLIASPPAVPTTTRILT